MGLSYLQLNVFMVLFSILMCHIFFEKRRAICADLVTQSDRIKIIIILSRGLKLFA